VGSKKSSLRVVQQGRIYELPPQPNGVPPSKQETLSAWKTNIVQAAELAAGGRVEAAGQLGSVAGAAPEPHPSSGGGSGASGCTTHAASTDSERQGPGSKASTSRSASKTPRANGVAAGCVRAYMGVSPALAEQLCVLAGVDALSSPSRLSEGQWEALYAQWRMWLERVDQGHFATCVDPMTNRWVLQYGGMDERTDGGLVALVCRGSGGLSDGASACLSREYECWLASENTIISAMHTP